MYAEKKILLSWRKVDFIFEKISATKIGISRAHVCLADSGERGRREILCVRLAFYPDAIYIIEV
jgi:hypothetical protein